MATQAKSTPGSASPGHVFWLFGLSGAGKSTLAGKLTDRLRADGTAVLSLDGDILRAGLSKELGYSQADRSENLRRAAEIARLGANSGLCVVASFITPLEDHRRLVTGIIGRDRTSLVHVSASLEVCRSRDVKGLYAEAAAGKVAEMTGVSSSFESPIQVDLAVETAHESVEVSAVRLLEFAKRKLGRG